MTLAAAQHFACTGPRGASPFAASKGAELGHGLIAFLACAGQEKMALLGYSPLPPNLVQEDFNAIGRLNGGQQPPAPTATNCRNPYVDGEVPLPGEPAINTSVANANSAAATAASSAAAAASAAAKKNSSGTSPTGGSNASGVGATATTTTPAASSGATSTKGGKARSSYAGPTASLKSSFVRFDALQHEALGAGGPSLTGPIVLWCLILALAVVAPPIGRWGWRRRRAHQMTATGEGQ